MEWINEKKIFYCIKQIDSELKNHTKKINIYCIGGTALVLLGKKHSSSDIDLIVPHEDFASLTTITANISEVVLDVSDDFMPGGKNLDYSLPSDYKDRAKKFGSFENLNLYVICDLDIFITKALAGRPKDYGDIKKLIKKISRGDVIKRFDEYRFKNKTIKKKLEKKLNEFIKRVAI